MLCLIELFCCQHHSFFIIVMHLWIDVFYTNRSNIFVILFSSPSKSSVLVCFAYLFGVKYHGVSSNNQLTMKSVNHDPVNLHLFDARSLILGFISKQFDVELLEAHFLTFFFHLYVNYLMFCAL